MRKVILNELVKGLENLNLFKKIYTNSAPLWTQIKQFPTCSVIYDTDEVNREFITCSNKMRYHGKISIVIYARRKNTNEYDDVLSDLIDSVETNINSNTTLQDLVIDCIVASIKQDGGVLHPHSMALIDVEVNYQKNI